MLWTRTDDGDRPVEEQTREGNEVQPGQRLWYSLVVLHQAPEASCPRENRAPPPIFSAKAQNRTGPLLLEHLKTDAPLVGLLRWLLPTIAPIHVSQLYVLSGDLLNSLGQLLNLLPLSCSEAGVTTMARAGVLECPPPRAPWSPSCAWPVVTRSMPALGRGSERAAVQDGGRGSSFLPSAKRS